MRKLIVTADDFGLAADVTDGIIDAYRTGIVSSTSMMVGGADAMRAALLAQQEPGMAVGIHLTLVDGKSVEPATRAPSILGNDGKFLDDYRQFVRRYVMGGINLLDVRAECTAQIHRFLDMGLQPSHLDSHQHMHLLPGIFEIVQELAVKFGIKRVRITRGGWLDSWRAGVGGVAMEALSRRGQRMIRRQANGLMHCDHFLGARYSCRLNKQVLLGLIDQVEKGSNELMCHPGRNNEELLRDHPWGRNWQAELDALTDPEVKERVRQRKIDIVGHMGV
jgi:hopanoid biosynthesis associated protein HpnK